MFCDSYSIRGGREAEQRGGLGVIDPHKSNDEWGQEY